MFGGIEKTGQGIASLWKKFIAWHDVKRDREKKVDDFFAPNGNFDQAINKINKNMEDRIGDVSKELRTNMHAVKDRLEVMDNKIQKVEEKIDIVDTHIEVVQEGLKTELFESLHHLWRECYIEQHYATLDQKERADKIYHAYHDINGNGVGTRIYNEIMNLETKDSI